MRDRLAVWASQQEPSQQTLPEADSELVKLPRARTLIAGEIEGINKGLAQYSRIKNFALLGAEWTTTGGELTPTQKLKRREILKKYAAEVESVYAEVGP